MEAALLVASLQNLALFPSEETQVVDEAPNQEPQQESEQPTDLAGELENILKRDR